MQRTPFRLPALFALLALANLVWLACSTRVDVALRSEERLGNIRIYSGPESSGHLVFLFSDLAGWNDGLASDAERIARTGAVVVGVDLPAYLDGLRSSDDGCHYVIAELEDLSHRLEREHGFPDYQAPLLAGLGQGGTLAYAALAQAPWATIDGAVSVDAAPTLSTRVPLCAGAPSEAVAGGGYRYGPHEPLPGDWWASPRAALPAPFAALAQKTPDLGDIGEIGDIGEAASSDIRLTRLVLAALRRDTHGSSSLADLPLTELPSSGKATQLAVLYSGDGGWRDIDKQIAEVLAQRGTPVIGVDSLRYFWSKKTPDVVARDLARILRHYRERWGVRRFLLIGYSFGADVLPFAVTRLPADLRGEVTQVSLLGLAPLAPFQIAVTGWLGVENSGRPVLPELRSLDPARVQCIYGEQETDTLCTAPELVGIERIRTRGGHHFDGNFEKLAGEILTGASRRR